MNTKQEVTSLTARLMATENISVTFDYVETASFNLETREMVLPIYEGVSKELEETFIAHECSHALYSDWKSWESFVGHDNLKRQYANIIEDVRIEKLIKRRFPGLVRVMRKGYAEMHQKDFFGISGEDLSKLSLIDRLNLHFKSYGNIRVPFSQSELKYVHEAESLETWEDVMKLVNALYTVEEEDDTDTTNTDEHQQNDTSKEETTTETNETKENDSTNEEQNGETGSEDFAHYSSELDEEEVNEVENNNEEKESSTTVAKTRSRIGGDKAKTVEAMEHNMSETTAADNYKNRRNIPAVHLRNEILDDLWNDFIIPAHVFLSDELRITYKNKNHFIESYKKLNKENIQIINNMLKEFDLQKSAAEHRRTYTSKTGNLNMNALYKHELTDDIFLSNEVTPEGKDHGVVMYVDFSGSMSGTNIGNSLMQIFNMVSFCTKAGIPYRVYGFTNSGRSALGTEEENTKYIQANYRAEQLIHRTTSTRQFFTGNMESFRLVEIVNSNLSKRDWMTAMGLIAETAWKNIGVSHSNRYHSFFNNYAGGTPLNTALYIAPYIIANFQKQNRVDKTVFMMYTDGAAGDRFRVYNNNGSQNIVYGSEVHRFVDPLARTVWNSDDVYCRTGTYGLQNVLTDRIRKLTGATVMGFDIIPHKDGYKAYISEVSMKGSSSYPMYSEYSVAMKEFTKKFKKEGFHHIENVFAFDSFTFVASNYQVENTDIDSELGDVDNPSTRKLQGAFMRTNRKNRDSRILVKKLMGVIG